MNQTRLNVARDGFLPESASNMLNNVGEIESYLRPSEINNELQAVIEACEDIPGIQAKFETLESVEGELFTVFVLERVKAEDEEVEKAKTVAFLDGLHTNEMIGGVTTVTLFKSVCEDLQILDDLEVNRLVYYHKNPEGMERNGDELVHGDLTIANYLKTAYRGQDKEWGYSENGGKYAENENGMRLLEHYEPQVLVALHNMGADGAKVHVTGVEEKRARVLSEYLARYYALALPEPGLEDVTKIAEGVYDTSTCAYRPEGYMDSCSWLAIQQNDARTIAPEIPYFALREDITLALPSEVEQEEIIRQAEIIDIFIEEAVQKWGDDPRIPNSAKDFFASVSMYYFPLEKSLEGMRQLEGELNSAELRMRLHFYPAFMLGHARQAVIELQKAGFKSDAVQSYIDKAEDVIDKITPGLEEYYRPTSRARQVKANLGSIAIMMAH